MLKNTEEQAGWRERYNDKVQWLIDLIKIKKRGFQWRGARETGNAQFPHDGKKGGDPIHPGCSTGFSITITTL